MLKYFLLFLFIYGNVLFSFTVEENIKQLSLYEKYHMQAFFNKAVKFDQAGHVLYCNTKPIALLAIVIETRGKSIKEEIKALRGWEAFKKHESLFPHPNFIFTENLFKPGPDLTVLHIYFINKTTLKSCLAKHTNYFKEILGPQFSSDEFISKLEDGQLLPTLVNNDESLIGILLGFGEESSRDFSSMNAKYPESTPPPQTATYHSIDLKIPNNCKFFPIVFVGNPNSAEVKQLVSTYEQELQEIWSVYRNKKIPLKAVLEKLCATEYLEKNTPIE